jgi:hypothetical protein
MPTYKPIAERLAAKTDRTGECWLWLGAVGTSGYGVMGLERSQRVGYVHRIAYSVVNGAIPEGLHIDHLCRNRLCVRPDHLEAVTQQENNVRAASVRWGTYTHCARGHEFTPENTAMRDGKYRRCRRCSAERSHAQREARKQRDPMYMALMREATAKAIA